jgi:WhiB family redox-sensing transcriptional regulator
VELGIIGQVDIFGTTGTEPSGANAAPLCAEVDPEIFFPTKGAGNAAAKRICGFCAMRTQCLELALPYAVDGIWGGTNATERKVIRRERGITAHHLGTRTHKPHNTRGETIRALGSQGLQPTHIAQHLAVSGGRINELLADQDVE